MKSKQTVILTINLLMIFNLASANDTDPDNYVPPINPCEETFQYIAEAAAVGNIAHFALSYAIPEYKVLQAAATSTVFCSYLAFQIYVKTANPKFVD